MIGITAYAEPSVRWGAWDVPAAVIPLAYVHQVEAAGGRALLVPPSEDGIEETLDALDGVLFSGGSDIDPTEYGHEPHPETNGHAAGARPRRAGAPARRARARHARARGLPRLPGVERRPRRRPRPAPARCRRRREAQADARRLRRPRGRGQGGNAARLAARRARPGQVASSPGLRQGRRGARRVRVGRRRDARGARGSGQALRRRRPLASGGGEDGALFRALVDEARAYRAAKR